MHVLSQILQQKVEKSFIHGFLFTYSNFIEIEEANWLTLTEDVQKPGDGFDAVICLGNSFAHLPDFKGEWNKENN